MHNPAAFLDTLSIVTVLGPALVGVSRLEVHRVSYLSCLLALYEGHPVGSWGYGYARTDFGTPYSPDLNDALDSLTSLGRLVLSERRYRTTETGEALLKTLSDMKHLRQRCRYVGAATGSASIVPPSLIADALDNEPTVQRAFVREKGGELLEGPALQLLHEQFVGLAAVLGKESENLLVPSVLWLSYNADAPLTVRGDAGHA
jgi:hypothetical protein